MATGQNGFLARLVTAVNDHDLEALVGLFATDYVNQTPVHPARSFTGKEQVRRNWDTIFAAVPDLSASVTAQAVVGDAVWTEWEMEGTRRDGLETTLTAGSRRTRRKSTTISTSKGTTSITSANTETPSSSTGAACSA
jgi:ketosteroid isomerase-like protein